MEIRKTPQPVYCKKYQGYFQVHPPLDRAGYEIRQRARRPCPAARRALLRLPPGLWTRDYSCSAIAISPFHEPERAARQHSRDAIQSSNMISKLRLRSRYDELAPASLTPSC